MHKTNKAVLLAFSALLISTLFPLNNDAFARGGGGGGGGGFHGGGGGGFHNAGFGGGYGRDFGRDGRDGFNRDFGAGTRGDFDRAFDQGPVDTAFGRNMPADFGRTGDNGVQSWNGGAARTGSLAGDGGYGRVMGGSGQRAAAGNRTERVSQSDLASRGNDVRNGFNRFDDFNRNWWGNHPNAWYNRNWDNGWAWREARWNDLAGWWDCGGYGYAYPTDYDYGDNISYGDDGNVYYGSTSTYTADDYYQQAENLACSAPVENAQPTTAAAQAKYAKEWKPLGVYALVQNSQGGASQIMQLCTNKAGIIRGNYYNALTNQTQPIRGAVDKKAQRVSWIVGDNKKVVYDTGISNLLKDQSPILVHYSKTDTQQWMLVRLHNSTATSTSQTAG